MYVFMQIYIYIYLYIMCIYIYMYVCVNIYIYICMCLSVFVYTCVCVCARSKNVYMCNNKCSRCLGFAVKLGYGACGGATRSAFLKEQISNRIFHVMRDATVLLYGYALCKAFPAGPTGKRQELTLRATIGI